MKIKSYISGFIIGIITTLLIIIGYQSIVLPNQIIDKNSISIGKTINDKINNISQAIKNIKGGNSNVYTDKFNKFSEIKKILDTQYIDPSYISGTVMWENALQAFVSALGDPFTVYLTATDNKSLHEELQGSSDFQGIGAVVTKVPDGIMLEQILKDSPAQKSGLKPLDIVLKSNGTGLANLPLGKAVSLIKGPAGTKVKLTIKRGEKIFDVEVTREKLKLTSVNDKIINYKGKKFGYISISSVGEKTYDQFKKDYNELLTKKVKGIILDLRGNGGGYLGVGYQIGAVWAKQGDIVVQTRYRDPSENQVFRATTTGKLNGFPTVILVNGYTASAGEIITAAIKENNKKTTKLVGTKTFGKGTIQTLRQFPDGSSLKYTIGKWYTPDNENVCKKGVLPGNGFEPDVKIKFDAKLYKNKLIDNQLEKAKKVLNGLIK